MASSLSLVLVLGLASGLWIAEAEGSCGHGWFRLDRKCYKFFRSPKQWLPAELHCIAQGGNLASIHSRKEHQFIRGLIRHISRMDMKTYVGGHDMYKEGVWAWSDGTRFAFRGWNKGRPNNYGGNENCLELNFRDEGNDIPCNKLRPYVCAKRG